MAKLSVKAIQKTKNVSKLTMITAYDYLFAKLFNETADIILVGDSLDWICIRGSLQSRA